MSNISTRILHPSEYKYWESFLHNTPQGTVFVTPLWMETICNVFGGDWKIIVAERGDKIIAGIPVFITRKRGIKQTITPPLTPYTGYVATPPTAKHFRNREAETWTPLEAILQTLSALRGDYIELHHHPSVQDTRPFQWQGIRTIVKYTYITQREDVLSLWENIPPQKGDIKRLIRKAQQQGLYVKRGGSIEELALSLIHI